MLYSNGRIITPRKVSGLTNGIDLIQACPQWGYVQVPHGNNLRVVAAVARKVSKANGEHGETAIEAPDA